MRISSPRCAASVRTSWIVVDSSALVELIRLGPGAPAVRELLRRESGCAPHVVDAEVLSAIRRRVLGGALSAAGGARALRALAHMPLARVAHRPLLEPAWRLRDNVSGFDALYVALAQRLNAPLMTADARLSRAPGLGISVTLVPTA